MKEEKMSPGLKGNNREKRMTWSKKQEPTSNFKGAEPLYICLFVALLVRNRRGDRGVSDSPGSPPLVETARDSTH